MLFLDSLGRHVRSGNIADASNPSRITLKPITIIYLIAEGATKYGTTADASTVLSRSAVQRMFDAIEVIELLQLAPDSQIWDTDLLSNWLLGDQYYTQSTDLDFSLDLVDLMREVRSSPYIM